MMRVLRALAFLAVGLLLGGVSVYASAETIAASSSGGKHLWTSANNSFSGTKTWQEVIVFAAGGRQVHSTSPSSEPTWTNNSTAQVSLQVIFTSGLPGSVTVGIKSAEPLYTCPTGQNWTLSGSQCTRPDCVSPYVRDPADGVCKPPACPTGQTKTVNVFSGKWAVCGTQNAGCLTGTLALPSSYCDGSCVYSMQGSFTGGTATGSPTVTNPVPVFIDMTGTSTGSQCSQATNVGAGTPPTIPQKTPPCAAGEGVLTTSTGTVKCVPEATPGNPPKTSSTKTTQETETDVKETTCTNTTDPVSGAVNKNCTTVTTPKAPGSTPTTSTKSTDVPANPSTPGQPGPDNSGDEPGQCEKEPDSPLCKKGTPKEKGQLPGIGTAEAELAQAKADLTAKFNEVKSAASQMFGTVGVGGGGSLPCPPPVSIMGKPISFCLTQYESTIAMIGGGVMFIAAILSAFIILL